MVTVVPTLEWLSVKEFLSALVTERMELTQKDMLNAVAAFDERAVIKTNEYEE